MRVIEGYEIGYHPALRPLADVGSGTGMTVKGPERVSDSQAPEGSTQYPNPVGVSEPVSEGQVSEQQGSSEG